MFKGVIIWGFLQTKSLCSIEYHLPRIFTRNTVDKPRYNAYNQGQIWEKSNRITEEEERILRAKKLEKERKKNARIQGPTTTNRPRNGSVPRNVMSGIEKMATADWPGDYQMQKFTIDMQVEAYNSLKN